MDLVGQTVVQVRKGDAIFRSDWLTNDDLIDVIKFIPVLIPEKIHNMVKTQNISADISFVTILHLR